MIIKNKRVLQGIIRKVELKFPKHILAAVGIKRARTDRKESECKLIYGY